MCLYLQCFKPVGKTFHNQKLLHFENWSISPFRDKKLPHAENSEKSRFEQFSVFHNFAMREGF